MDLDFIEEIRKKTDIVKEARLLSGSLSRFMAASWPIVHPGVQLAWNWHLDAICEHLEAIEDGRIKRLIINMPPRHTKSMLVAVMWPAWAWTRNPQLQWLFASYHQDLSDRDSMMCRRIVTSEWYQERWGHRLEITDDENRKRRYETKAGGARFATSTEGMVTGAGGDRIVVDDPHNAKKVHSELERQSVITWWRLAMSTRGNDPKTTARVIVMQRLHEHDLTGYIMAEEGDYDHLCLPSRFDPDNRCTTSIGWTDPREKEGELIWPDRFDDQHERRIRKSLGPDAADAQMDQRPSTPGGNVIRKEWIKTYDKLPVGLTDWCQSWDMTFKGKDSSGSQRKRAFVVGQVWARRGALHYLVDQVRGEWDILQTMDALKALSRKWPQAGNKWIEDKANGPAVMTLLRGTISGLREVQPDGDKLSRLYAAQPHFASGSVYIPNHNTTAWVDEYIHELTSAPQCRYWDQVDTTTQALAQYHRAPAFCLSS